MRGVDRIKRNRGLWYSFWLFVAAASAGCDFFFPPPEEHYRAIDIYVDRYEYRFNRYTSIRRLGIALQATTDELSGVNVRECVSPDRLAEVLDLLRRLNRANVVVSMPDDCRS